MKIHPDGSLEIDSLADLDVWYIHKGANDDGLRMDHPSGWVVGYVSRQVGNASECRPMFMRPDLAETIRARSCALRARRMGSADG